MIFPDEEVFEFEARRMSEIKVLHVSQVVIRIINAKSRLSHTW